VAELDLVKTGISGFDAILSSGIPRGNVILVEGGIGTGKTTMGVEFVYRGASMFGEPGIIVLFEVSPDRLVRDAACFGWDLHALERQRKLKIIFTTRQVFREELQQTDSLLLEEAAEIGARRIYVDGVAGAASAVGGAELRDSFHVLVEGLQREKLTAVFAVEASAIDGDRRTALPEESIADTVIRLRMEERFRATVRSIEVVKSRGHDFDRPIPYRLNSRLRKWLGLDEPLGRDQWLDHGMAPLTCAETDHMVLDTLDKSLARKVSHQLLARLVTVKPGIGTTILIDGRVRIHHVDENNSNNCQLL
jgi:KaiC/GvpD/RAD55 family RecA-like ATPase